MTIPINPKLLTRARERAGLDALALAGMVEQRACKFQGGKPENGNPPCGNWKTSPASCAWRMLRPFPRR